MATRGQQYNEWAAQQTDLQIPLSWIPRWEPYDGPDAETVQQFRDQTVGNCILFNIERAIGSMYFAESDEQEEIYLYEAKQLVRSLRS